MTAETASPDARELVTKLAEPRPDLTFLRLKELGLPARDAVVEGLKHGHWQVRRC